MNTLNRFIRLVSLFLVLSLLPSVSEGREQTETDTTKDKDAYEFTVDTVIPHTPVKNQARTGTCWCFSTVSFLESEAMRMGKDSLNLSEMFVVRHVYPKKAVNYIRRHGTANFSQGGQSHDVIEIMRDIGLAPESVYPGMQIGEDSHNHGEMVAVLTGMVDAVLKRRGGKVTPRWLDAFNKVLDTYLGVVPASFEYKGKTYTPETFADRVVGLKAEDYIELTSYSTAPFYTQMRLDIPDNWDYNADYYNVPIDDLEAVIDHALKNGYSVVWDGDVSEKDFSSRKTGYGIVPETDRDDLPRDEQDKPFTEPVKEKAVSQEMRQETLDDFTTTDDHLMHIVGLAHDQNGTKFYYTKNSGGPDRKFDGYVYMSESYVRLKTTAVMVHKDAIPAGIAKKLKLD